MKQKAKPKPEPQTIISGRVPPPIKRAVDEIAKREQSTRSVVIHRLLALGLRVERSGLALN